MGVAVDRRAFDLILLLVVAEKADLQRSSREGQRVGDSGGSEDMPHLCWSRALTSLGPRRFAVATRNPWCSSSAMCGTMHLAALFSRYDELLISSSTTTRTAADAKLR